MYAVMKLRSGVICRTCLDFELMRMPQHASKVGTCRTQNCTSERASDENIYGTPFSTSYAADLLHCHKSACQSTKPQAPSAQPKHLGLNKTGRC